MKTMMKLVQTSGELVSTSHAMGQLNPILFMLTTQKYHCVVFLHVIMLTKQPTHVFIASNKLYYNLLCCCYLEITSPLTNMFKPEMS